MYNYTVLALLRYRYEAAHDQYRICNMEYTAWNKQHNDQYWYWLVNLACTWYRKYWVKGKSDTSTPLVWILQIVY